MPIHTDRDLARFRAPLILDVDAVFPRVLTANVLNRDCDHCPFHFHLVPILERNDLLVLVPGDFWVWISGDDTRQTESLV